MRPHEACGDGPFFRVVAALPALEFPPHDAVEVRSFRGSGVSGFGREARPCHNLVRLQLFLDCSHSSGCRRLARAV